MLNKLASVLGTMALLSGSARTADTADWKKRSVYQLVTDRFAKTVDDKAACSDLADYCGGTFKGIQNHLDYI